MGDRAPLTKISEVRRAHLVGIGGTAMTPLATILLQMGIDVTGSDLATNQAMGPLRSLGARIFFGHRAEHVGDVDIVVASSAVPEDNPELAIARARGIRTVKHSAALGSLMRERRGVAVAGTHGKTTTSALIAFILDRAGLDPTFLVGSELLNFGLFGRRGQGEWLVAEADEFDRRFLDYDPEIAIVTSVEPDHLDYFGSFQHVVDAFLSFVERVRPGGAMIVCCDDPVARDLPCHGTRITYGLADDADWRVTTWDPVDRQRSRITLRGPDGAGHDAEVALVGSHNAVNVAAAVATASHLRVPWSAIQEALAEFRGTRRRFELIGIAAGVAVVDDYAHHPTAIRATLAAARAHYRSPIWAIFQPHTAHRTMSLFDAFAGSFGDADHVILAPTYRPAGREANEDDPTVRSLAQVMNHPDAAVLSANKAVERVVTAAQPGDLVLVMGAGDIWTIAEPILEGLRTR